MRQVRRENLHRRLSAKNHKELAMLKVNIKYYLSSIIEHANNLQNEFCHFILDILLNNVEPDNRFMEL